MTRRKPLKFSVRVVFTFVLPFLFLNKLNAQLLDSVSLDTARMHSLTSALKVDPLNVYKLSLRKLKLTEVPVEIYDFKNLQVLVLNKNKIKVFPKEIAKLGFLQELEISNNKIDSIPKEIGNLVHLRKFAINQNRIANLPKEIGLLKNLTFLDLWGNNLGSLPDEIGDLKNSLKELDMRVILMSTDEQRKIKKLLPNTKIKLSKSCNCGF